jgi:glycine reductase
MNQFFGGIGGEESAGIKPESRSGAVGPGMAFSKALQGKAEIVGTVICGDGYFAENMDEAVEEVLRLIGEFKPDAVITGPAFNAGRYGTACGSVADAVGKKLKLPVVSGMYQENPGVDLYRKSVIIIPTSDNARGIKDAVPAMTNILLKLLSGEALGDPRTEGYLERGIRVNTFHPRSGAERAVDMLVLKMRGEKFETEYPMPVFDRVAPADPIKDLKGAKIALLTDGGIVPTGNPDRIEASSATKYATYSFEGVRSATSDLYQTAHGGYDPTYANQNPNRVLPLDVLRDMEDEGVFAKLHETWYTTVGNGTPVANGKKFGSEIGAQLKKDGVDAVILTST